MMLRAVLFALTVGTAVCLPRGRSPRLEKDGVASTNQRIREARKHVMPGDSPRIQATEVDGDTVLVEMDMKMKKDYYDYIHGKTKVAPRKGLRDEEFRWTDNTIPYEIDSFFNDYEKEVIRGAMDEWEKYTCLKLKERNGESDYVRIISGYGCWSYVGMQKGMQELSLDVRGCVWHYTAVHEFGHAVGFHHEQTRPDRDQFVEIYLSNVESGQEHNFDKYNWDMINDFGVTYDYWSVMHYEGYAFSAYGGRTIKTLNEDYQDVIGQVPGLSFKDIQAANRMYHCDSECTDPCPEKAIRTADCKCWCNNNNPGDPLVEWDEGTECMGGDDFTDTCLDYNYECETWATGGECDANPSYMLINCRKSCKVCGDDAVCKNYNNNCDYWAMIGECSSNPAWMNLHCPMSCRICGHDGTTPDPDVCEDRWSQCAEAASYGDCERYSSSMLWECPLSCRVCGDNIECRNWDILCTTWESMGECDNNPDWMNRHCARACRQCEGGDEPDCKNYGGDTDCDYWAGTGECVLNPGFMLYQCTKSCRVCGENADCLNYSPNCAYWKSEGLCETDKPGMNFNCPRACELCTGDGEDTDDCENNDWNCERWEEMGECDANPLFMLYYCPRSCKVCGDDQVCKNFHDDCEQWASEGECDTNPGYMLLHCRPACGVCSPTGSTTPRPGTTTTRGPPPDACDSVMPDECKDDIDYLDECIQWADEGKCDSDYSEMWRLCQKTCRMCGPDAVCKNFNPLCEEWAGNNQCEENPGHLLIFCRKACSCC